MKKILPLLLLLSGLTACTSLNLNKFSKKDLRKESSRVPAADSDTINLGGEVINVKTFTSPDSDRKDLLSLAKKDLEKQPGVDDEACLEGDYGGYLTYCDIVSNRAYKQKLMKDLGIDEYELWALKSYTDFGFQGVNNALWNGLKKGDKLSALSIKYTISAFNKMDKYNHKGSVIRCDIGDRPGSESETLKVMSKKKQQYSSKTGSLIKGFWSTSLGTHPDYIKQWIDGCRVILNVELKKSGRLIAKVSDRPWEEEVLVRPMTRFKYKGFKEIKNKKGQLAYEIDLEEVE